MVLTAGPFTRSQTQVITNAVRRPWANSLGEYIASNKLRVRYTTVLPTHTNGCQLVAFLEGDEGGSWLLLLCQLDQLGKKVSFVINLVPAIHFLSCSCTGFV